MVDLINYYSQHLKNINELPDHISFNNKERLKNVIIDYYKSKKSSRYNDKLMERDLLYVELSWNTGGRVGDVCNFKPSNINYMEKLLKFTMQKTNKELIIPLDSTLLLDIQNYCLKYNISNDDEIIGFTTMHAWRNIKKFGRMISLELKPHMFRHGIAIHLMNKGTPIPYITALLGHSSPYITMSMYLKVTPDMMRKLLPLISGDLNS